MGTLYCGDCLEVLEKKLEPESVDFIYADPPFFSNRTYEVIWGDEAEVRSFEDRWEGGVEVYAEWMAERLRACHRALKPNGSLFLHCDYHASHYLKLRLDGIFGRENFRNELIWRRTHAHGGSRRFAPVHDTIFFYSKGEDYVWTDPRTAHDPGYIERHFKNVDMDGRRFQPITLTGTGVRHGDSGKPWRGKNPTKVGRHWAVPGTVIKRLGIKEGTVQQRLDALDKAGLIFWPEKGGTPRLKWYADQLEGQAVPDVWTDIPPISAKAAERLGYPTQKPEALLERIIKAATVSGALVVDPFCGCGTTLVVAQRLKRKWVGVDISHTAIRVIKGRLAKAGAGVIESIGLVTTAEELRLLKPFEFQNWVVREKFNGTVGPAGGDKGVDGLTFMVHEPIQVKQSDSVGRIVVDNFLAAIRRTKKKRGYIVAFSFGKGAYEEAAAIRHREDIEVRLITVDELLSGPPK